MRTMFLLFALLCSALPAYAEQMEFKVVGSNGYVYPQHYPTSDTCRMALRSFPQNSQCIAAPKEDAVSSPKQMEFKVVGSNGYVYQNRFPTIESCRTGLPSFAPGSQCVAMQKD